MADDKYPSVYNLQRRKSYNLYLGDWNTKKGLSLFEQASSLSVLEVYFDHTVGEKAQLLLKASRAVGEFIRNVENCVGMYELSCVIGDVKLETHDDGECHFYFPNEDSCRKAVMKFSPENGSEKIWLALVANDGKYVVYDAQTETITIYQDFDAYLSAVNVQE